MLKIVKIIANHPKWLLGTMGASLLACSAIFSVIENHNWFDSLYWGVTTAVTVGYGDLSPNTVVGKVVTMYLMLSMVLFFLPMVVVIFIDHVRVDPDTFSHDEQVEILQILREIHREVDEIDGIDDFTNPLDAHI